MTMEEPGLVFHVIAEAGDNVNIVNSFIEYLTDVFAHDKKEILEFCEVCLCQVCCYSCVFGKRNYRVLVRVSVCVCVCFCTITQKEIDLGTRNWNTL